MFWAFFPYKLHSLYGESNKAREGLFKTRALLKIKRLRTLIKKLRECSTLKLNLFCVSEQTRVRMDEHSEKKKLFLI